MTIVPASLSGSIRTALFTFALAAAPPALAELPQYTVTKLDSWWGAVPAEGPYLNPLALNNSGEILVSSTTSTTTYQIWSGGMRTDPGPAVFPEGYVNGGTTHFRAFSNDGIQAVDAYNASLDKTGLVSVNVRQGTATLLPDIPGAVMDGSLPVLSSGGTFMVARSDDYTRGWLFEPGTLQWTEMSGPGWYVQPDAVNNSGAAAGRMADASGNTVPFVWTAGAGMEAITDQGAAIYGQAMAINDAGFVTGTADGKAFVLNSGNMELTWLTDAITGWNALDINNAGAIIGDNGLSGSGGIFGVPSGSAFYWDKENGAISLDNVIGDAVNDWFITGATDINDDGWILGTAFQRSDSTFYQVLLRPVPEPGAAALLAFGSLGFLRRGRESTSSPPAA